MRLSGGPLSLPHVKRKSFVRCSAPVARFTTSACTHTCCITTKSVTAHSPPPPRTKQTYHEGWVVIRGRRVDDIRREPQQRPDGYWAGEGYSVKGNERNVVAREETRVREPKLVCQTHEITYKRGLSGRGSYMQCTLTTEDLLVHTIVG